MIGRTLSHFRITARIGEGGMGVVYRAEDENLRRPVALKVLPPELIGNEERRLRFLREARAAAAVNHPNIATVYEVGEADGQVFIAMEHVEGRTLRALIAGRPLPIKEGLALAIEMAEGLARAHQAQVVHRDLKPDNVIVTPDHHVKILDFGLARLLEEGRVAGDEAHSRLRTISGEMTRAGKILGTAAYMSPEQARGEPVDARSDIFSFGIVLYEMVTGKVPFQGKTTTDTLTAILRDRPAPATELNPEVPPELERVIDECLEKDPADRCQHADQLAVDLRRLKRTTDSGVQAVRTPGAPLAAARAGPSGSALRRLARSPLAAVALAVALAAGGVAVWRGLRPARALKQGDQVLVADFANKTGRTEFDATIRAAFEGLLGQSSFLQLIRGDDLKDLMTAQTGGVSRLDAAMAERLCAERRCAGYVAGTISAEGTGCRLEVDLHLVGTPRPVLSRTATASSEQEILAAIHALVLDLRRGTGESPQAVSGTPPPGTRSLEAYQLYAMAQAVGMSREDERIALLKRAIEIDPRFVDAYSSLAISIWNIGEYREWRRLTELALKLSGGLHEKARLWNEINYLEARYAFDTEVERLRTYQRLYPFDYLGPNALALIHDGIYEDLVSAEAAYRAAYRILPTEFNNLDNLAYVLRIQGKAGDIEQLALDYRSRGGSEENGVLMLLQAAAARGDWRAVLAGTGRFRHGPRSHRLMAAQLPVGVLLAAGRLREAREAAAALGAMLSNLHDLRTQLWVGTTQAWLAWRRNETIPALSEDHLKAPRNNLIFVRSLAALSVDLGLREPLAGIVEDHRRYEKDNPSRFVREELQFADGCLALIAGQKERARDLLEPLARNSEVSVRHYVGARMHEALGRWAEAAREHENFLSRPWHRWYLYNPAAAVLNQFRLAQIYERLNDATRARQWYGRFLTDWKDADQDIPELGQARERLAALDTAKAAAEQPRGTATAQSSKFAVTSR